MLKIVVFDGGFGGELFADQLEEELPIVEVIRVIDWRHADKYLCSTKEARRFAIEALRPYIGRVDLIVLANHFVSLTSLQYFRRQYKKQKFVGLDLVAPDTFIKRDLLILTTKNTARTLPYHKYIFNLKRPSKTITLDSWPNQIDDGELTTAIIHNTIVTKIGDNFCPAEIVLACTHFNDIKGNLRECFGANLRIYDSFDDALRRTCRILGIRGGIGKKH